MQQLMNQKMSRHVGWRVSESLNHAKFGDGVIVNIEGSGAQARAHINFGRNGMKLLHLGVAKLERGPWKLYLHIYSDWSFGCSLSISKEVLKTVKSRSW